MNDQPQPTSVTFEELRRVANSHPAMRIAARVRGKLRANAERGIASGLRNGVYGYAREAELGGATRALTTEPAPET